MTDAALRLTAAVVALGGILVAGYLTWAHYGDEDVACPIGGSCEAVQSSEYAEIAGIPVALLGLIAYVVILALVVWDAPVARLSAAVTAFTGLLFSVYLLVVQLFVIDAICIWCMANDVVVAPALALICGLRLGRTPSPTLE